MKTRALVLLLVCGLLTTSAWRTRPGAWRSSDRPAGDVPPVLQGGEWWDELTNLSQLTDMNGIDLAYGRVYLKYHEQLQWTQTWTAHFTPGVFFHTEAVEDAVRLALIEGTDQYYTTGAYTSTVFDAGRMIDWASAQWAFSRPPQSITMEFRTGDTPAPDLTWSGWRTPEVNLWEFTCVYALPAEISECDTNLRGIANSRYLQYRAAFQSDDPSQTVALFEVSVAYGTHVSSASATSIPIAPSDLREWQEIDYTAEVPASTTLTIDVLSADGELLLSNLTDGASLAAIDPREHPAIKLQMVLGTSDPAHTPELDGWGVKWLPLWRLYLPHALRE